MSIFASAPFLGPTLGPIIGGFLGETEGWRWVEGLMAIFTGVLWILGALTIPETYSPVILSKRAKVLSKATGKVYKSKIEVEKGAKTPSQEFKTAIVRPWILLFREPIVLLLSIYMAIIYGTLYMLFGAFPIVYQQARGWSQGIGGLSFLGVRIFSFGCCWISKGVASELCLLLPKFSEANTNTTANVSQVMVGMILAVLYSIWDNGRYARVAEKHNNKAPPEARLPPSMIGSVCLPVGLFWFAWTNYPSIHWSVSIIGAAPFGFGMVLVFLSVMNYLIDSYVIYAASVLAANSVLRSLFGTIFPLFTTCEFCVSLGNGGMLTGIDMYKNLGIHWASSVPGFLALLCVPFPFLFYKYGESIRLKCKYAAEAARELEEMRGGGDETEIEDEEKVGGGVLDKGLQGDRGREKAEETVDKESR